VNFGSLGRFGSGNLTDSGHKKIVGGAKVGTEAVGSRPFSGVKLRNCERLHPLCGEKLNRIPGLG
jgi:hypothetical protein